jgi:hypothetical protein
MRSHEAFVNKSRIVLNLKVRMVEATVMRRVSSPNWEWLILLVPLMIFILGMDLFLLSCSKVLLRGSSIIM